VHLLGWGKAVEFAKEARPVTGGPFGKMGDKGLDQVPAGFTEFLGAAEFSGIALDHRGIELMLADQEAESVPEAWVAVVRTV
jgi:hypothetical protein